MVTSVLSATSLRARRAWSASGHQVLAELALDGGAGCEHRFQAAVHGKELGGHPFFAHGQFWVRFDAERAAKLVVT